MISNGLEFRTDWSSNLLSNWQSYDDTPIAFDVPLCRCSSDLTDYNSHYPISNRGIESNIKGVKNDRNSGTEK